MKRYLSFVIVSLVIMSLFVYVVNAHGFNATGTNVQTNTYYNGNLINVSYSWGGDDHPYCYIYEYKTISNNMYHEGFIPKINVDTRGPYGTIQPTGYSSTFVYYDALYGGWINCQIITVGV